MSRLVVFRLIAGNILEHSLHYQTARAALVQKTQCTHQIRMHIAKRRTFPIYKRNYVAGFGVYHKITADVIMVPTEKHPGRCAIGL